ncbi:hypothetical protein ACOSP6_00690 [Tenacibaculum sp. MEBiC06402]|uniref:hypothetical protein n=1 Tax=unclassified Tenacibaculum TaxID=2635139 RepID=UPI003B9C5723
MKKCLGLFVLFLSFFSCKKEKNRVVGFHDSVAISSLQKLQLDDSYINLLNPSFSKKEEYQAIIKSWSNFHNNVNEILTENEFSWGVPDSSITVVNKIYFTKNGKVNNFLVNIKNENVTLETKNEYVKLLNNNLNKLSIDLKRDKQFAQCGKVKYKNYE